MEEMEMSDEERNDAPSEMSYTLIPDSSGLAVEYINGVPTGSKVRVPEGMKESVHERVTSPDGVDSIREVPGGRGLSQESDPDDLESIRRERDEMRARYESIAHLERVQADPIFRELVSERIERGEFLEALTPAPAPEDIIGYHKRAAEPESESILQAMREYAETLPEWQKYELQSNHKVWNQTYDRFRAGGAGALPPPRPAYGNRPPLDRQTMEEVLRSKEVFNARVEPPGPALPEPPDENESAAKRYAKAKEFQRRAYAAGSPMDRENADLELVKTWFAAPKKSQRRDNY
jgi:hypothetical protein